jgi:hypothetical protein
MTSFVIDFRYIEQLGEQTGDGINCNHTMMYIKEISLFDEIILTGGTINIVPLPYPSCRPAYGFELILSGAVSFEMNRVHF